jgi:hypothetical protein
MPITAATFDPLKFRTNINIWLSVLPDMLQGQAGQKEVARYRPRIQATLQELDGHMTRVLGSDTGLLTLWGARMRACVNNLDALDRNLPFTGKRQWNWSEVFTAMALLEACKTDTRIALLNEGVDC